MWGWFKRRATRAPEPLAAFDAALSALERQGGQVRRAAATLLALRADLARKVEGLSQKLRAVEQRVEKADGLRDVRALAALRDDEAQQRRLLATAEEALMRSEVDCELLTEAARELRVRQEALETERSAAQARLQAGLAHGVVGALGDGSDWIHSVRLEEARDEVERAHALADIYRETQRGRQG